MNILPARCALAICLSAATALTAAPASAASNVCVDRGTIKEVYAGYVDTVKGADSGNAVKVVYQNRSGGTGFITLNTSYNLNDTPGPSLLSLLMLAQTTGQQVTLKDHFGTICDDFDEVVLHGY